MDDPVRRYLMERGQETRAAANEDAAVAGINGLGAIGSTVFGPLGQYVAAPAFGTIAAAKLKRALDEYAAARAFEGGAAAFGRTGLPGRGADAENMNPLMYYLDRE
jgi:hypothetical protein